MHKKAFTLIELLLAMALLAILAILLIGNFTTTLKRGRDSQRKNDLNQLQKVLELYYDDNNTYPPFTDIFNKKLCTADDCNSSTSVTYMVKTPRDPSTAYTYVYVPAPTPSGGGPSSSYYLYSYIENSQDTGAGISQTGYTTGVKCDAARTTTYCTYYVGSSNAATLTPNP